MRHLEKAKPSSHPLRLGGWSVIDSNRSCRTLPLISAFPYRAIKARTSCSMKKSDFFAPHNDGNESSYADNCRVRQVSAVVFLNDPDTVPDRFLGGELVLYGLVDRPEWEGVGMPFPAKTGTLLAFRSALWHEVKAVTEGRRCTVVTWYE